MAEGNGRADYSLILLSAVLNVVQEQNQALQLMEHKMGGITRRGPSSEGKSSSKEERKFARTHKSKGKEKQMSNPSLAKFQTPKQSRKPARIRGSVARA